jgi:hypothetical protein
MRFHELKGGINIPLSNEEHELLERIKKNGSLTSDDMDERDIEVATKLYKKHVLNREETDSHYIFTVDELEEAWRE